MIVIGVSSLRAILVATKEIPQEITANRGFQ
jgi:hypothetical protein